MPGKLSANSLEVSKFKDIDSSLDLHDQATLWTCFPTKYEHKLLTCALYSNPKLHAVNMNAYLQAVGWVYPLSPKVTTIGQSGCDIIINNASVDQQHAVIERDENQNVHILRDLCSEKGTYINNIQIRDAAVILKQGDQIRFGSSPTVYGFELGTLIGRSHQGDPAQLRSAFVTTRASVPLWVQSNQTEGRENKSSNTENPDQTFSKFQTRTSAYADHENLKQPSEKPKVRKTLEEELTEKHANAVDAAERARENEAYEKTMTILRQKHKASEMRCDTLRVELEETRMKLERAQKTTEDKETSEIKLRGKLEKLKVKLGELERSERQALSAVQANQNKYESLRNRIMRVLFAVKLNQPSKANTPAAGDYQNEAEVSAASLDSVLIGDWDDLAGRERSNNALVDDMDDNHIVDRLQSMIEQMLRLKRQVSEEEEQRRKRRTLDRGIENDLDIFVNLLADIGEPTFESTKFRSSLRIKNQLDRIATHSTPFTCL
ncbi:Centrosomal protein of 170 kDa, partial [Clonorchis sinensis]